MKSNCEPIIFLKFLKLQQYEKECGSEHGNLQTNYKLYDIKLGVHKTIGNGYDSVYRS